MAGDAVITGPVSGGEHGWPFGAPSIDVAQWGYDEVEFLMEGVATRYELAAGTGPVLAGS